MSDKRSFFKASSGYALAQIIGFAASLLSFPLLTRILSVSEYGVLGLCSTSLLVGCAISKLGIQNSIIRYYYEYRNKGELSVFFSTFWWGGVGVAALISLLLVPVFWFLAPSGYRIPFLFVVMVVFGMSVLSLISNFLRAEERNGTNAIINLVFRLVSTFTGIAFVYYFNSGISGIFLAQFAVIVLITSKYAIEFFNRFSISIHNFSQSFFCETLSFGVPLIAFELSSIALAFSDRYLITHFCGPEQLGIYTAGYTLCFYIADTLKQPLGMSVVPIFLRLYTEQGVEATVAFIREIIGYVFLVISPVFAGTCAIKEDLLVLLASSKYSTAAVIIPWVLGSTLLYACQPILAAGFTINKQSRTISIIIVIGAVINVLLNIVLLPRFGIIAAAWSTAVAYMGVLFIMAMVSARSFPISLPYLRISFYLVASAVMYFAVIKIGATSLPYKVFIGGMVYTVLVLIFDRKVTKEVITLITCRFKILGGV